MEQHAYFPTRLFFTLESVTYPSQMFLSSGEEFVSNTFQGTDELTKMYSLVEKSCEETQNGAAFRLPKTVCIAQKSM